MHLTSNIELSSFYDELQILVDELVELRSNSYFTPKSLRKFATERALKRRDALTSCAKKLECCEMKLARNIAATLTKDELPYFQILLESWWENSPLEPANEHRALIDTLSLSEKENSPVRWLLSAGRAPNLVNLVKYCKAHFSILLTLEREISGTSRQSKSGRTVHLLKTISAHVPEAFELEDHNIFAKQGFKKGLPPLGKSAFSRLPKKCRQWILRDQNFARVALTPEFYESIWLEPLAHPDTPDTTDYKSWLKHDFPIACTNLEHRNFNSCRVSELLRREDLESYSSEILTALSKNSDFVQSEQTISLRRPLSSIKNRRLRNALAFFTKTPSKRLLVIATLEGDEISKLAQDVSLNDWILAVKRSKSKIGLERISTLLLKNPSYREALFDKLAQKTTSAQCLSVFLRPYLDSADDRMVSDLFNNLPSNLSILNIQDLTNHQIRGFIEKQCITPKMFSNLSLFARGSILRTFFTSKEQWMENWREEIATLAKQSTDYNFHTDFIRIALHHAPTLITKHFNWKISKGVYSELETSLLTGTPAHWHRNLLRFIDKDGEPYWEESFRSGKRCKLIKRLIKRHRPGLSKRLAKLEINRLLDNESFKEKLGAILTGKTPKQSLRVSQEQLRHFIPWAREKWKDKPTLAVAFELALTFSISDLRYFVVLCTQRWKSDRQGREGMIFDHLYKTHQLPKKSGGNRTITVPDERLKGLQRKILRNGFDELFVHPSAHGFKRGRSILTNATVHVQQTLVLNVDIQSFFPNTRYKHILRASSLLLDGQLSEGAKRIVADICSYNGGLPTGAPTSPAIANLVLRAADTAITKAAQKNGIVYSRYADDLTFSGESNTLKLLPFVKKVLAELGYELDPKKTNIFRRGRRQIVTGLVVNEKPNLPRRIRRRLRAAVHQMCNSGESRWHGRPMSKNELLGRLSMLHLVQPEEAKALKRKLAAHATL